MSHSRCVGIPRAAAAWMALAVAAGTTGLPATAAASRCLDLAGCVATCHDAACEQSCTAGADARTRGLLQALADCLAANCPPGSPNRCQSEFCQEEFLDCKAGDSEPTAPGTAPVDQTEAYHEHHGGDGGMPSNVQGGLFSFGFGYGSIGNRTYEYYGGYGDGREAFLLAYAVGWDGNWLDGPSTSTTNFNVGIGFNIDLTCSEDGPEDSTPAAYVYFHYFFPDDLTDGDWTFFGLGLQLEAGATGAEGVPTFVPQGLVTFRWMSAYTMNIEAFVGPELAFPDSAEVGVTAGARLSVGFQFGIPPS